MEVVKDKEMVKLENQVYKKSSILTDSIMNYCPGCGHGTINRIIAEVVEEMGIQEQTIGVGSVGCSAFIFNFLDIDFQSAPHGRASAVATGIKRVCPDKFVFAYQGDGDLAAIGTAESIHTCNRGDNYTIIFVNNGIYGMTGGQMAPTSLIGMKTATSPYGREVGAQGNPLKMTEIVAQLPGTNYVTRQSVHTPAGVRKTKKAIRIAFESQKINKGLSFVEIVTSCSNGLKLNAVDANTWMENNMFPFYPMGDIKVDGKIVKATQE